jgi:hypothetical protein
MSISGSAGQAPITFTMRKSTRDRLVGDLVRYAVRNRGVEP